jgi:hypothetical protein
MSELEQSMRAFSRAQLAAVAAIPLASLAICVSVFAQISRPAPLPIPADDSDLTHITALAAKLKTQGQECKQCRQNGGSVYCDSAKSTAGNADALRAALYGMKGPLQQAALDAAQHLYQFNKEHQGLNDRNINQKYGLAVSKVLLNSAKVTLDLISLTDTVKGLSEALENSKLPGSVLPVQGVNNLSVVSDPTRDLGQVALALDGIVETASGTISSADDVKSALPESKDGFLSKTATTMMTLKGACSDAAGAIRNYQAAMAAYRTGKESAQAFTDAGKGVANLLAKALVPVAEKAQEDLADEIANNEYTLQVEDRAMQTIAGDMERTRQRQLALDKALDAVRDAAAASYACASTCSGALGPQPIKGYTPSSQYGQALKDANAKAAALTSKLVMQAPSDLCKEKGKDTSGNAASGAKANCQPGIGLAGAMEGRVVCPIVHSGQ